MKKIILFDTNYPKIRISGFDVLNSVPLDNALNYLQKYGDEDTEKTSWMKKAMKEYDGVCVAIDLFYGKETDIYLGLCLALLCHKERVPFVIYVRDEALLSYHQEKILCGTIKKITQKEVLKVTTQEDWATLIAEIEKILLPVESSN